jgi:hypothetical protein
MLGMHGLTGAARIVAHGSRQATSLVAMERGTATPRLAPRGSARHTGVWALTAVAASHRRTTPLYEEVAPRIRRDSGGVDRHQDALRDGGVS